MCLSLGLFMYPVVLGLPVCLCLYRLGHAVWKVLTCCCVCYSDYSNQVHVASVKVWVFGHWCRRWRMRRALAQHQDHMTQLANCFQTRRFFCRWQNCILAFLLVIWLRAMVTWTASAVLILFARLSFSVLLHWPLLTKSSNC